MTRRKVVERFQPMYAVSEEQAREELDKLRYKHRDNPDVHFAGLVETRRLPVGSQPLTAAKWCVIVRWVEVDE